jgi:hypothetical protein
MRRNRLLQQIATVGLNTQFADGDFSLIDGNGDPVSFLAPWSTTALRAMPFIHGPGEV